MIEVLAIEKLGEITKRMRKEARLSQEDLAGYAGLSRTAIQALESGKQTCQLDTLFKVLKILNIRMSLDHPLLKERDDE